MAKLKGVAKSFMSKRKSVSEKSGWARVMEAFKVQSLSEEMPPAKAVAPKKEAPEPPKLPVQAVEPNGTQVVDLKLPIAVRVLDVAPWKGLPGHNFVSPNIIITSFLNYGEYLYIRFIYATPGVDTRIMGCYAPLDFQVYQLDEAVGKEAINYYDKWINDNLIHNLTHDGITMGSDPEVFITNKEGTIIPAYEFLPSKQNPIVDKYNGNETAYWDGFQAEFTTAAGGCLDGHASSVHRGLLLINAAAKKYNKDAKLSLKSVMEIPREILENAKPEHVALGCAPSFNAYGIESLAVDGRALPFRPAGGHIHFGVKANKDEMILGVKAMDAIIGVACVSLFANIDNPLRRSLYGLPGEYRLPPHGVEYRTLSNAWLCHPVICHIVFDLARKAFIFGCQGMLKRFWKTNEEEIIRIIRSCDVEAARKSMNDNKEVYLKLFESIYRRNEPKHNEVVFNTFIKGAESIIKDVNDIETNWKLNNPGAAGGWNWRSRYADIVADKKLAA